MATTTNNPPVEFLNGDAEKGDLTPTASYPSSHSAQGDALVTEKSRGVRQMEALQSRLSTKYRILLYGSFALLAYVMSLGASPALDSLATVFGPGTDAALWRHRPIHKLVLPDRRHLRLV